MSNIIQLRLTNRPPRNKYKMNLEIPKTNHKLDKDQQKSYKRLVLKYGILCRTI